MSINGNQTINNGDYAMRFPIIQENQDSHQAVDARDLYLALGLDTTHWARWSKQNIADNPFALQGRDYGVYASMANTKGGRPTTDYLLSIDFAKKLAMQVRTKKGEEVRDYFLECERKASQPVITLPDFTNPVTAARAWANELEAKQAVQAQLTVAQPKINHYDYVVERAGLLNATQVAQKVKLSAVSMNKALDELGVYNKTVKRSRVFQQWFIDKGFGEVKQTDQGFSQALFTKRGEAWVIERLVSEGVA